MQNNSRNLEDNLALLLSELGNSSDLGVRHCKVGHRRIPAALLWINGMVDLKQLNKQVLSPLLADPDPVPTDGPWYERLLDTVLPVRDVIFEPELRQCLTRVLAGWVALLVDGGRGCVIVKVPGFETRSIEEPASSVVIRGPRDGFVEELETNISLVRRRLRNNKLRVETLKLGSETHTSVSMLYLEKRSKPEIVAEIKNRLSGIQLDAVLESQYIEEMIKDRKASLFPTVYSTERPDDIVCGIIEGRVAILVDGTPFGLIVPSTFFHFMKTPEDFYLTPPVATLVRWIRFIGFLITLLLPAIYVGVLTFHPEMLPPQLLSSILSAREGVPFPLIIEELLMELTFEGLREASIRMPRAIGSAVSIVGALVLGESAVNAGIISSPTVIVVAGTAIASFTIPSTDLSGAVRLLRFLMIFISAFLGLYGILIGLITIGILLTSLRSVGIPYFAPFAPFNGEKALKTLLRMPWYLYNKYGGSR